MNLILITTDYTFFLLHNNFLFKLFGFPISESLKRDVLQIVQHQFVRVMVMVFKATFNNASVISWQSV